jgi:hypothetical protein
MLLLAAQRAVLVVAAMVVTYVLLRVWRRRAVLELRGDVLRFTGLLGSRVLDRPHRAIVATVRWASGRESGRWLLLDAGGATLLGLDLTAWDESGLAALERRLGLAREHDRTPRTPADLRRRHPGAFPWPLVHPFAASLILIAAVTVLLAVAAAI